jgi:hypothetical protein
MGVNMLLTIGGLILLGTFILYANSLLFDNAEIAQNNEFVICAISLAQSVIDEAKTKKFDEAAVTGSITTASSLSSTLGTESGEALATADTVHDGLPRSASRFDDVDDYNGYVRVVHTARAENYNINTVVSYASETNPDSTKTIQTFCKRMGVTVTSPFFSHPVEMMYAFVY